MNSHKILPEIVPYLQKTKHKLLYKKKCFHMNSPREATYNESRLVGCCFSGQIEWQVNSASPTRHESRCEYMKLIN